MKSNRYERGQALVLIILAVAAMFGFAALAVDIGRIYSERRRIQNAADSAALAAVYAASQSQDYMAAAFTQLQLNGVVEQDVSDIMLTDPERNPSLRLDVEIHHPPASGAYGPDSGRPLEERNQYYQVILHSSVDQIFSQFVYQDALAVTVEAVGRLRNARSMFAGDVLHATSHDACQGIKFAGTGNTHLIGGDAFSDSNKGDTCPDGDSTGGASCVSATILGTGDVWIEDGTVITSGEWNVQGTGNLIAASEPETCRTPQEMPFIPEPDCGNHYESFSEPKGKDAKDTDISIYPGIYSHGITVSGANVHLEPGMYCLDGDLRVTGGNFTGDGVFIYMRHGSVDLLGNAYINLKKAEVMPDASGLHDFGGFLILMPYDNDGKVHLGGGSDSEYSGTIFAPGPRTPASQDKCIIEGNGTSLGFQSNIICYTIKITGKANVTIDYQEEQNHRMPPFIELAQ